MLQRARARRSRPAADRNWWRGGYLTEAGPVRKALGVGLMAACCALPASADGPALLSHEATYALALAEGAGSGITSARGMLVVTVEKGCEAWHVRQGIALSIVRDDEPVATVSDFESREALDGAWYGFEERTAVKPGSEENWTGKAVRHSGGGGTASLTRPQREEAELPTGTLFPMAHLADVLARARAGERVLNHVLFDGTEGLQVFDVTTLVGTAPTSGHGDLRVWPLRLAFFVHGSAADLPDLEVSARLRDDGVAVALAYDYGGFVLAATLTSLEPLPPPDC